MYFIDDGERFPTYTYNSWMITFSYDISPYRQHIGELKSEMDSFYSMIKKLQINAEKVADRYGSVYVPLHVFFIFYLSTLILEKSTLILENRL